MQPRKLITCPLAMHSGRRTHVEPPPCLKQLLPWRSGAPQEKSLLVAVKEEKLREMAALGVPDKYQSQLAHMKPGKF